MAWQFFLNSLVILSIGTLPALLWLWFWLREDSAHPEPRRLLALAFFVGMLGVVAVLPIQGLIYSFTSGDVAERFILWAAVEELVKFAFCWFTVLQSRFVDERIDPVIYLLTTGLGFAALENMFFIAEPIISSNLLEAVVTSNLRFIGANLVHVLSSVTLGFFLSFAFYKSKTTKFFSLVAGLLVAIGLHTGFNLFIIETSKALLFIPYIAVWLLIGIVVILFETVKRYEKVKN